MHLTSADKLFVFKAFDHETGIPTYVLVLSLVLLVKSNQTISYSSGYDNTQICNIIMSESSTYVIRCTHINVVITMYKNVNRLILINVMSLLVQTSCNP